MIKLRFSTVVIALSLSLLHFSKMAATETAHANTIASPDCSIVAASGHYPFVAPATVLVGAGTVIAIPDQYRVNSPAIYASAGMLEIGGDGIVTLTATADVHGPLATPLIYQGTYSSGKECTATIEFAEEITLETRMMWNGRDQRLISTTPGFVFPTTGVWGKAPINLAAN